ncbi:UNVERIFIED_CONTAM: hypothetical protein GTU68_053914 [Idotea baltica]|nr:hypothetical protein [Idotea baltica]
MAIRLIVGLGNPGQEYAKTRHNAGALFVEEIAKNQNITLKSERKYFGLVGRYSYQGQDIRLLLPTTYMNLSGQSVAAFANFFQIQTNEILVAHDELDIPPGTMKLKHTGGHGGHNGLRSIISQLDNNFHRLRIGIGHPGNAHQVSSYVLGKASNDEQEKITAGINEALNILPKILTEQWPEATQKLHSFQA